MNNGDKAVHPIPAQGAASIGLTKREEFAKAAMVGILADSNDECVTDPALVAREAVNYADALLAELAKTNEE